MSDDNNHLDVTTRVWPVISDDEISRVLARLATPLAGTALQVSNRPTTAGILVDAGDTTVFIKRYGAGAVPPDHLRAVHGLVAHVRAKGFPTPAFLPFADGDTVWETPTGTWEVCEGAIGEDRYRDDPTWTIPGTLEEAHALGTMTARLALASADYRARNNPPCAYQSRMRLFADDPRRDLAQWIEQRGCGLPTRYGQTYRRSVGTASEVRRRIRPDRPRSADVVDPRRPAHLQRLLAGPRPLTIHRFWAGRSQSLHLRLGAHYRAQCLRVDADRRRRGRGSPPRHHPRPHRRLRGRQTPESSRTTRPHCLDAADPSGVWPQLDRLPVRGDPIHPGRDLVP